MMVSMRSMPGLTLLAVAAAVAAVVGFIATGIPAVGLAFLVASGGLLALPGVQRRRAAAVAATAGRGTPGSARVITVEPVTARGGVPRVKVTYEVTPSVGTPYRLSTRHTVPPSLRERLRPGAVLAVRIDPENPKNMVLDSTAG